MDKYILPFFFNNIKPSILSQSEKKHLLFNSHKTITIPQSNYSYVVDISSSDNNYVFLCLKSGLNQVYTIHTSPTNIRTTNFNSGLLWPVRELIEFFGLKGLKVVDNRNLLLDYSSNINPLLKSFPCEGLEEVYFNFFSQKTSKFKVFFIEL